MLVGKAPCENVIAHSRSTTTEEIRCTITDSESGYYFVDVHVGGKGWASVGQTVVTPGSIRNSTISADAYLIYPIYPTFFLASVANTISPLFGSLLGGTMITITGSGFSYLPSHLDVQIGSTPCHIVSSSFSMIRCISSAASSSSMAQVRISVNGFLARSYIQFEQSLQFTPTVSQVDSHQVVEGDTIVITGTKFGMNPSAVYAKVAPSLEDFGNSLRAKPCLVLTSNDTSIACTVPAMPSGTYGVYVLVDGCGLSSTVGDVSISYPLRIESFSPAAAGYGGGLTLEISGTGFPENSSADSVIVSLCGADIQCPVTLSSHVRLLCKLGAIVNPHSEQNCSITVSYNGVSETSSGHLQLTSELTPHITDLSPTVGGTAGGTTVILTGTGFFPLNVTNAAGLDENDIVVTIDQTVCAWYGYEFQLSETSLRCRTSEHRTTLQAIVQVFVRGKGYAVHSGRAMTFEYIDRWSSPYTWGGSSSLPVEGESVYIRLGQTVFLDISPPVLNLVLIEGTLIFEDEQDLHLQAKYIFVNGGNLQVRCIMFVEWHLNTYYFTFILRLVRRAIHFSTEQL